MLVDDEFDLDQCRRACRATAASVLVPNPYGQAGSRSGCYSSGFWHLPRASSGCGSRCQQALDGVLRGRRFHILVTSTYARLRLARSSRPGSPRARLRSGPAVHRRWWQPGASPLREANWRKLRSEELGTYRDADGVYLCSAADERRLWSTWHVSNADLPGSCFTTGSTR
jgi:hypothetical protein